MSTSKKIQFYAAAGVFSVLAFTLSAGVAQARHVDPRAASAVHRLHEAAEHFHHVIHDRTGYSQLGDLAHQLADDAGHLHETIENGTSYHHARRDFGTVRSRFLRLDHELNHAHSVHHDRHVMRDWRKVEEAAARAARLLGTSLWHDRHGHARRHSDQGPRYRDRGTRHNSRSFFDSDRRGRNSIRVGPLRFRF